MCPSSFSVFSFWLWLPCSSQDSKSCSFSPSSSLPWICFHFYPFLMALAFLFILSPLPVHFSRQKTAFVTRYPVVSPLSIQGSCLPRASVLFQSQETGGWGTPPCKWILFKKEQMWNTNCFWYSVSRASSVLLKGRFWWNYQYENILNVEITHRALLRSGTLHCSFFFFSVFFFL